MGTFFSCTENREIISLMICRIKSRDSAYKHFHLKTCDNKTRLIFIENIFYTDLTKKLNFVNQNETLHEIASVENLEK